LEVEMYPDLRELCTGERYPTAYTLPDGGNAEVFSSGNKQTVIRHMKWVRDYNTDGVFVQRFISEYGDKVVMAFRDSTTVAVMEGCEQYGRVFSIMYDGIANRVEDIKIDWMHLVDNIGVTSSDRYLQHEGRPLVALWGYTVRDNATVDQLEELIDWFHNTAAPQYQASIKLGLNDNWFNEDQRWMDAFAQVEVISPWSVGRYKYESEYNNYVNNQLIPGRDWCKSKGVLFVPVLFPGFSWHNLKEGEPQNQIPRNGGNFFWMQAHGAINNGLESMYFAMFDEVDEGTAFFKTAENSEQAPAQEYWLNLDADGYDLPSDWYLRCAGQAAQMLRGDIAKTSSLGTPDEGTYTIFARHPGSDSVPMGITCLGECWETSTEHQLDNSAKNSIQIFPNPAKSNVLIEGLDGTYQIEMFDMLGRKCKSITFNGTNTSIDISDLPNALYIITVNDRINKYSKKIHKTR